MKLFLVSQAREAVPQIFKDHGLTKATPTKPSEVPVLPLTRPTLSYLLNAHSVHAHLNAEIKVAEAYSDNFDYVLNKVPVSTTFECPPLRLVFSNLSSGEKDTLIQLGMTADTGNVYSGQLPVSAIQEVSKMKPLSETYRAGTVDWDGYVAWTIMMRFLTIFSYASRSFNDYTTLMVENDEDLIKKPGEKIYLTKTGTTDKGGDVVVPANRIAVRFHSGSIGVLPSKNLKSFAFSQLENITALEIQNFNLVLPFFEQMLLPDGQFTFSTFMTLFGQLFGFSAATPTLIAMFRRGISSMAFSTAGRAISHAVMAAQMATQAGTSVIYIVHRGVYHGAMLGSEEPFSFMLGSTEYAAAGPEETQADLLSLDQHTHAIARISSLLTGKINGSDVITVSTEDIKTSRLLYNVLRQHLPFILANNELKEGLEVEIERLRYMDQYEEPSQGAIIAFLDFMITGDENLLGTKPAFLKNGRWMKTSRVDVGLSAFGPLAPSINWGADKKPSEQKNFLLSLKGNELFSATPTKAAMYIPYKVIAVNGASNQWQLLFRSGTLSLMPGRKDKKELFNLTGTKANITGTFAEAVWAKAGQVHLLEKEGKKRGASGPSTAPGKRQRREEPEVDSSMLF